MNNELNQLKALVCGSTQGIGLAVAQQLAQDGFSICLTARNEQKLQEALSSLSSSEGQNHTYFISDFTNPEGLKNAVQAHIQKNGPMHILVNNTGGPKSGPIVDADPQEFLATFNQHLICNHILMQALLPGMKAKGYGRIVNIISTSVKVPLQNLGVSNTIRGAVGNWSKTIATELAPYGITVNNILPGATETERLGNIISNKSSKLMVEASQIEHEMLAEIPMGRFGKPQEPAYAACFLCSEFAAYITGTNIVVDGGRTPCL